MYNQRPEVKEKRKEYNQRPEVQEKRKEYNKLYKKHCKEYVNNIQNCIEITWSKREGKKKRKYFLW